MVFFIQKNSDAVSCIAIIHALLLVVELVAVGGLDGGDDDAGQCQQRYDVRHDHELVEHIRQLPDEVVGEQRAEEDERDRDDGVDEIGLLAEEVAAVDAAEHVPADNGGEREPLLTKAIVI